MKTFSECIINFKLVNSIFTLFAHNDYDGYKIFLCDCGVCLVSPPSLFSPLKDYTIYGILLVCIYRVRRNNQ